MSERLVARGDQKGGEGRGVVAVSTRVNEEGEMILVAAQLPLLLLFFILFFKRERGRNDYLCFIFIFILEKQIYLPSPQVGEKNRKEKINVKILRRKEGRTMWWRKARGGKLILFYPSSYHRRW